MTRRHLEYRVIMDRWVTPSESAALLMEVP